MEQNYKVFYQDKPVLFTDNSQVENAESINYKVFRANDPEDINRVYMWMTEEFEGEGVVVITDDPTTAWNEFQTHFKIVEAAGGFVDDDRGNILCIYRLERWDLPKGKIDKGETREDAAVREVMEECALSSIELKDPLGTTFHIYPHKGKMVFKPTYWYRMTASGDESIIPQTEEGITEVRWVPISGIKEITRSTYPSLLDVFERGIHDINRPRP